MIRNMLIVSIAKERGAALALSQYVIDIAAVSWISRL